MVEMPPLSAPGSRVSMGWTSPLMVVALTVLMATEAHAQEPLFADGFEALAEPLLDCERLDYPCSLADADPDALARVIALLQELGGVRENGTMEDVRAYLESQPDVIDVFGDYRMVSFRVDGMSPAVFDDTTAALDEPLPADAHGTTSGETKQRFRLEEVVGEDSNADGTVDQKDIKRALVMAPFEWQFGLRDESSEMAELLALLPGYAGNVLFKRNPVFDLDCASCGGSVTIDTLEEELSVSGSASFTMVRVVPEPEGEEEPPVTLDVDFVAAYGSQFDGGSPYVQCSILYGD